MATAQRDIADLVERGILTRNPGGSKNSSYSIEIHVLWAVLRSPLRGDFRGGRPMIFMYPGLGKHPRLQLVQLVARQAGSDSIRDRFERAQHLWRLLQNRRDEIGSQIVERLIITRNRIDQAERRAL